MGKKTRERRQPQQLVSRIEKDLGELLSDGSVDRESVRTALEHVHALRKGGVPFPEETLSGYIKRTRPGYTANHTPSSASKKLTNISKAVHEAGLIQKRRKKVRGTKLFLAEGDVETRQSIDTFLDKDFTEDGIKKRTEEIELLTDYLRENRPTYFSNSTEGGAYQKAIRIAKVLREAGIIERREPIGAATLYLDKGDEETRASIDEYLNENYTEDGNDADEEAIETVRQYLLSKKPKYFARLTKNGKISRIHYIIHQLLDAGIIEERERKKKSKFWLGDGDEETRASIDEYLDENLTEDGIKKIRTKPTPSDSTEKIEILTSYLRENRPTYFTKLTKTSAYNKAIKIAKNLHEAGKIKKREPIGAATLYLDKGDTETRQSIDEYLNDNLTEKGIKKRTEEIELLTDYLRKTKPTYFTGLTKPSAKNKAARLANKLRKAGIIKKRKPIGKVIFYLDKEDTKTRQSIDEYLDKHLTEDEGGKRADDTDEEPDEIGEVEILTNYLRETKPKYFANSTEGSAHKKAGKIANELHEAGKIKRRKAIGRATLYLDEGDEETRASIDEYLNENYTEDGNDADEEAIETVRQYLLSKKQKYFARLTKNGKISRIHYIIHQLLDTGIIEERERKKKSKFWLGDGDEETRASIDEYLDENLTEDGIKKIRAKPTPSDSTEKIEILTSYLRENRPTYFSNSTEGGAYQKAIKIAKVLHEAGIIERREPIGRATLYLDEGDTETRASIDDYLDKNLTEDGKKKREPAEEPEDTDEKEEVELLTDYLRKTKPTYFTGLTKPSAKNKAEKIANKLHEAGKIKKRKPVDRVTLYLDDGDEATRASIDEYLDKNLTEDGIKKRRSTEEVELLTNYLIENRPTYFTGLTERSAKNKAEKIAKGLREAGKIKKREPVGRATLYLDKGDTETRQSIDEYLNENLTEDGKKKIIGRPLKEQPPKKWEDVGGVERTDNEEPDENDLAAIIDESDEDLEEYKPKVRKRSKQPSLAGRVKKKATRSPRKVDPLPDFETIGHFIERERPHILGLHTPIQEKVRILEGMINNMEKNGVVEKRPRINEAEYFLLDHEDDKRARILDYLDKLSIPPQAVEQRKPEHDGTVASYLSGKYLSGLDKRLQLQTLNEWIKNLNEDDIIEDGEDPLSPELQDEIDGYIEHLQQRTKEDPSPQQRTKEDPSPQQRTRKDPSQCTLEDIAEKIGIPVAIVESYNYELIGMSINRNIVGRIVNGIRLVTDSYDGELMSMENIVEETRIPLKYLKWFDMRVLGKYIQIVQNGKKICEGWDSARATTFIESVRMPWKGERGYNTKPAK